MTPAGNATIVQTYLPAIPKAEAALAALLAQAEAADTYRFDAQEALGLQMQAEADRDAAVRAAERTKAKLVELEKAYHLLFTDAAQARNALRQIIDYVPVGFISPLDDEDSMNIRAIARAALTGEGTE